MAKRNGQFGQTDFVDLAELKGQLLRDLHEAYIAELRTYLNGILAMDGLTTREKMRRWPRAVARAKELLEKQPGR